MEGSHVVMAGLNDLLVIRGPLDKKKGAEPLLPAPFVFDLCSRGLG